VVVCALGLRPLTPARRDLDLDQGTAACEPERSLDGREDSRTGDGKR